MGEGGVDISMSGWGGWQSEGGVRVGRGKPMVHVVNIHYRSWQLSSSGRDGTLLTITRVHLQVKVENKVGIADLLLSPTHTCPRWDTCVCVC